MIASVLKQKANCYFSKEVNAGFIQVVLQKVQFWNSYVSKKYLFMEPLKTSLAKVSVPTPE